MKQGKCRISVVVPVYNSYMYLRETVEDILVQTEKDFELICVDDGSTDGSSELLDEYSNNDGRIRVIHQENSGGGMARNAGLKAARGKYLIFLDSDDRFEPDLLEKAVAEAEKSGAEVVAFGGDTFDHSTGERRSAPWLIKGNMDVSVEDPFAIVNTSVWNKVFLRQFILKNSICFQNNRIVDTMSFVFLAVVYAERISVVNEKLYHYRTNNSDSILANSDRYPLEAYEALLQIKERLEKDGYYSAKKNIYRRFAMEYLADRLHLMKTGDGFSALYDALHDGGMERLGLESNEDLVGIMRDIFEKSACEYLFDRYTDLCNLGMIRRKTYSLTDVVFCDVDHSKKMNVVLYGAGDCGRDFFAQILSRSDLSLVCWVDNDYERIGYPVCSPEVVLKMEYDVVLIAVSDQMTAESISKDLVSAGVDENRIIWRKVHTI